MTKLRKLLSLVLALCLCMGLALPGASATGEDPTPSVQEEEYDPYVFVLWPDTTNIPAYYQFYARPYYCISAHSVIETESGKEDEVCIFNLINTGMIMEDENQAPGGGYATVHVMCADYFTGTDMNIRYRMMNLEDSYFGINDPAACNRLRAIMRHIFPACSAAEVEAAANAYLTEIYGDSAVAVTGLTGAELLSASQAAVWHYTNGVDFHNDPYCDSSFWGSLSEIFQAYYTANTMYLDSPVCVSEEPTAFTRTNIAGVYEYLINLPGEEYADIVITDEAVSIVGSFKVSDGTQYDLTVLLDIDGIANNDDELILSASYGDQTVSINLDEDAQLVSRSRSRGDALYAITFTGLSEKARSTNVLSLNLNGSQSVQDIFFYEAEPTDSISARDNSQGMIGLSSTTVPVMCSDDFEVSTPKTIQINKVDAATGNPLSGVAFDLCMTVNGSSYKLNTYYTDENGMITVDVADDGSEYYFVESEALPGYDPVEDSFTGGTVENKLATGSLAVSKKVINTTAAQDYEFFRFNLTLDLADAPVMGNDLAWLDAEYIASVLTGSKELSWTVTGDTTIAAQFTLEADETITIDGIPMGAVYTLEEVVTEEDRQFFSVTAEVTAGDGAVTDGTDNVVSGTVAQQNAVLYTNAFTEVVEETTVPETTVPETTVPETTVPPTTIPKDPDNPATGDAFGMMGAICILSVMLTAALYLSKRRFL